MNMENKTSLIIMLVCIFFSCNMKKNNKVFNTTINNKDSIVYELPIQTTNKIVEMLANKKVSHCGLICNSDNNKYTFSFPYDDKCYYSKRDTILLNKTNTFLKLNIRYIPIIHLTDILFSNISINNNGSINDFNYCFVVVDAKGKMIESFEY